MKTYYELGNIIEVPNKGSIPKNEGNAHYADVLKEVREGNAEIVPKPKVITYADIDVIVNRLQAKDVLYKESMYSIDVYAEYICSLINDFDILLSNQNVIKKTASNSKLIFSDQNREVKSLNKADLISLRVLIIKRNQGIFLESLDLKNKLDADTLTEQDLADWKNG